MFASDDPPGSTLRLSQLHRAEPADESEIAYVDPLTRLPNRRHASVYLEREFERTREGRPVAVVFFALEDRDPGHDRSGVDERAVRALSRILVDTTRKNNLSARWTDDVFLTVLSGSDAEGGLVFADRVQRRIETSTELPAGLTVRAGVAWYHEDVANARALLDEAEEALGRSPQIGMALATPESEDPSESRKPRLPLGRGLRVLVVEDDADLRKTLLTFLAAHGFNAREAPDVPTALWDLRSEYDLLLTDVRLPGGTGTELVSALKGRWPETQAIVVTGMKDATVAAEAVNAGADAYLFKPFQLSDLRDHLAAAVERRRRVIEERHERRLLTHQARARHEQAERAILRGARALVRAVEVRDPYTQGHSMRVSAYAAVLAGAAADGVELDALRLACELHDVGKIGVPDAILNKTDSLTDAEYEEVRQHPLTGRRILEPLLSDESVLAVVKSHHERWDGSGYPEGLVGDAIPFVARLVAIVDALDAMTSTRAYRIARSWDASVDEIRRSFGLHFDPGLAGPFEVALPTLHRLYEDLESDVPI